MQGTDLCSQRLTGALTLRLAAKKSLRWGWGGAQLWPQREGRCGRGGFHGLLFWPRLEGQLRTGLFALAEVKERTAAGAQSVGIVS